MKVVENKQSGSKTRLGTQECVQGAHKWLKVGDNTCRHTKKKSKHIKMVKNVFCWPFLCAFNSCHVCIYNITHFQLLLGLWMHSWVPASVFGPNPSFLTNFWLLLSILSCFYLFPTIFNYSLSILPISNRLYLFSTVFTQIWVFPHIFTYHFLYFPLYLIIFTHFSSPLLVFHHLWPSWLIFNHLYLFLTIFSNLQLLDSFYLVFKLYLYSQVWTHFQLLLFISDH